jgi:hypothetical protein
MDCHPVVVAAKDADAVEDRRYMRCARCSEAWRVFVTASSGAHLRSETDAPAAEGSGTGS